MLAFNAWVDVFSICRNYTFQLAYDIITFLVSVKNKYIQFTIVVCVLYGTPVLVTNFACCFMQV